MTRAFILGGTGVAGRAVARRLLEAGWRVDVVGRNAGHLPPELAEAGCRFHAVDRNDTAGLRAAFGKEADLLVDCVCFTGTDASGLLPLAADAGVTVMISSKAVYADGAGHHVNSEVAPRFDGPIKETQPTVAPGDGDYRTREGYGANKVAAEQVLLDSGYPVTVIRPSKIHGAWARRPREWVFVKRALDRRPVLILGRRGEDVDHTTAATNLAALIETVAAVGGRQILNSADPDSPSVLEISRAIAHYLEHDWVEVLLDGFDPIVGRHPWEAPHPIILDMSAAIDLGYRPVGGYAQTVADEIKWLVAAADGGPGADLLPAPDDPFFGPMFDYDAEDRYLAMSSGEDPPQGRPPGLSSPLS
ncbi:MAG TPA: NAD-dependent epimerase/dehydratase family protein [Acidimicrobiia bacterium]|nr:NAD-dependent epimerase/dehydratase family protein [Acidimicrobiia bacterium]